jgi:bifunctional DNase/RNase
LVDGVFFSSLICEREGKEEVIDTRTSDAIAIAVRFNAPIYTYENILDKAGIYLKVEEEMAFENKQEAKEVTIKLDEVLKNDTKNKFSSLTLKELNLQLNNAVTDENYELAAKIRDEISNRS